MIQTKNPTQQDDVNALLAALATQAKPNAFGIDLAAKATRYALSDKQMHWVRKLTAEAAQPAPAPAPSADLAKLVAFFDGYEGKAPRIRFQTQDGLAIRLSVAGERAKQPGSINVCSPDKGYDDRTWYGRVTTQGQWQPSGGTDPMTSTAILAALTALAEDPWEAAAQYGRLTGTCCFCHADLDNAASAAIGYGPTCAKKWGRAHSYNPKLAQRIATAEGAAA